MMIWLRRLLGFLGSKRVGRARARDTARTHGAGKPPAWLAPEPDGAAVRGSKDVAEDAAAQAANAPRTKPTPGARRRPDLVARREAAGERADIIASMLDVSSSRELQLARVWLQDLFARRAARSTFLVLQRLAGQGLDLSTLRAMDALRQVWEDQPDWWSSRVRMPTWTGSELVTVHLRNGSSILTWTMARDVCLARRDLPPEEMIDPDWFRDWHALPQSQCTPITFARFVTDRATDEAERQANTGSRLRWHIQHEVCRMEGTRWEPRVRMVGEEDSISLQVADIHAVRKPTMATGEA